MAVLTGQAKIDAQAKVTALANDTTNASNELLSQSDFLISEANKSVTINPNVGVRFGGNNPDPIAVANSKSSLTIQKIDIRKRIRYNQEFITNFSDETKSWVNDPAIASARQQVQTSTLALESSIAKIDETLATLNGAGPQIAATAAPDITTQDTAQRDVVNTTSPATAPPTNLSMPELSKLVKNRSTPGGDLGVIPNTSNKTEPATDNNKAPMAMAGEGTLSGVPWTGPILDDSVPNVLHGYASYTYGLSLHLLSADEYNKIVEKGDYKPNRVLIASAGRYNNTPGPTQFIRSPRFNEDFYFDNFDLETVVGLNAQSRNSNAIQYHFTLIEPYGFTLIDRIIDTCNDPALDCNNYLDMPYLLQIDFFGVDDTGEIVGVIPNTTKRIPIRLNKMEVKISARGAEYAIKGVPYNHSAFDLTTVSTPINVEVEARTVAQFFQSNESAGGTTDTSAQRENSQSTLWASTDGRLVGPDGQFTGQNQINPSLLSIQTKRELGLVKSYGTALNNFQKAAYDSNKIGVNDKYFFDFVDPEIANSPFTSGALSSPKDTGMIAVDKTNSIKKSDLGFNTNDYDPNLRIFQVNAGTYIDQVISWVIRNSKWMTDQVVIPDGVNDPNVYLKELADKKDTPLYWFKVVPSIKLVKFDKVRKIWGREITYHIQKYKVENVKIDVGPGGTAKNPVKYYDYIYTGQNNDILDLDIQFNALYYNALTIYREALTNVVPPATATEENKTNNAESYQGLSQDPNAVMPLVNKIQVLDARSRASGGSTTAKQVAVADLEASLMTLSQADMLHVKLKILGDPCFIKQDDVFWTPKSNTQISETQTNADPRLTPDGSLKMDNGEVYVQLTFRTPVDIDETTGLMKFNSKTTTSLFSGLYRVLTINNEFRAGQFTQTLNLVRLVKQGKLDYTTNKAPVSDNRNTLLGQTVQMNDYMQGPNFNTPDVPKISQAVDDAAQSAQQAQENNRDNADPNVRTTEEDNLVETRALAPEEPISETNLLTAVPPGPAPSSPTAATPGSVFDGISAADLQYIRSQSVALGLNPSALNGYLTNRLQDYEPNLRAKVASDVVKLKEILRKRNQ